MRAVIQRVNAASVTVNKQQVAGIKSGLLVFLGVAKGDTSAEAKQLAKKIKAFVVPEINYGQMVREVERSAAGKCPAISVPHCGGWVHDPVDIFKAIKEAAQ